MPPCFLVHIEIAHTFQIFTATQCARRRHQKSKSLNNTSVAIFFVVALLCFFFVLHITFVKSSLSSFYSLCRRVLHSHLTLTVENQHFVFTIHCSFFLFVSCSKMLHRSQQQIFISLGCIISAEK